MRWASLGARAERLLQRFRPPPRETGPAGPELIAAVTGSADILARMLDENILGFWLPRCLDPDGPGYRLHHDEAGKYKGPAPSRAVSQARTLWFFARMARRGRRPEECLAAARSGLAVLRDRLWDQRHGGFFWEADAAGSPSIRLKYFFAQSFPLYALSELALASGDPEPLALARASFDLLERELRDPEFGGYWDRLAEDWSPAALPPALTRGPGGLKTMNVQMHALEAITTYVEASGDARARERLLELVRVQTRLVYRERWGCCSDAHRADWAPLLDREHARASYGHDVENISLVLEACRVAGLAPAPYLAFFRRTFQTAMHRGWDARPGGGGFFREGPFGAPADDRTRSWWVQAEALAAALELFQETSDGLYARCYLHTLDWVLREHVDWRYGEWHAEPLRAGTPAPDKAGPWKEPYHTGRSVLRCLELAVRRAEDA